MHFVGTGKKDIMIDGATMTYYVIQLISDGTYLSEFDGISIWLRDVRHALPYNKLDHAQNIAENYNGVIIRTVKLEIID